jgi:hypothetical protein
MRKLLMKKLRHKLMLKLKPLNNRRSGKIWRDLGKLKRLTRFNGNWLSNKG